MVVLWLWAVIGMTAALVFVFLEPARLPAVHQILIMGSVVVAVAYLIFYSWKWQVKETKKSLIKNSNYKLLE